MATQQNPQSESNVSSTADAVDTRMERLNELLMQAECPNVAADPTFSGPTRAERRKDRRHPFLTEVVAVLPGDKSSDKSFRLIRGWSINFGPSSIGFVLPEHIDVEKMVLMVDHPDFHFPHSFFSARPLRVSQTQSDEWEYGAILRPLFEMGESSEHFDRSLFEMA